MINLINDLEVVEEARRAQGDRQVRFLMMTVAGRYGDDGTYSLAKTMTGVEPRWVPHRRVHAKKRRTEN